MKKYISAICFLFFTLYIYAIDIKGVVVNNDGEPEAFATVRLFNPTDSVKAISLGITDDDGAFSLNVADKGDYQLIISSVGKKTINIPVNLQAHNLDLGTLTIEDNAEQLGEIEVVAMRPLVSKEIDRIGYDVQADEDSRTANLRDILRKVPMVTVDADGTVKVKGSTNFKIYKNGRPNNSFSNNAKEIFAAIPASMIKKIEVITDPGAREDAEGVGAILNIVTNETSSMTGIMGSLSANYEPISNSPWANLWLTAALNKLAISANGGYFRQGRKMGSLRNESDMTFVNTGNQQITSSTPQTGGDVFFWGVDGSYDVDSLNLLTLEFNGFAYNVNSNQSGSLAMLAPDGSTIYSYTANGFVPRSRFIQFDGNFNYQHLTRRKGESLTLSYQVSNNLNNTISEQTYTDLVNYPAPFTVVGEDQKLNFWEHTGQFDWTRPFADKHTLSVGGKFIHRRNTSDAVMTYDGVAETTDFSHLTTIAAAYAEYRVKFGRLSARAGLRYEYSHLAASFKDNSQPAFGSDLHDWVPNLSFMYTINDFSTLKASYSSRINRPGINYLNPVHSLTPNSDSYGNPDLESIHYNQVSLNYSLIRRKFNIDLSASYEFANNTIASITEVDNSDFKTSTYFNIGDSRKLYFSLFGQFTLSPKTQLMTSISASRDYLRIPEVKNARWGMNSFLRLSQQLPWKLRAEGMLMFNVGGLSNVYSYNNNDAHSIYHILSLQRSFLKEDRLTVEVTAVNPFAFHDIYWRSTTNRGPIVGDSYTYMEQKRNVQINISYRFGSLRSQVKKVARGISNDDLQGGSEAPISSN